MSAGDESPGGITSGLDTVPQDPVRCGPEHRVALDVEGAGAEPLNVGAHRHQAPGQIRDLGFPGGILDAGFTARQHCRHQGVFRGTHRDMRKTDPPAAEPAPRRARAHVAPLQLDGCTEFGQGLEMQVDGPGPDGTAAGQRNLREPRAGEKRPQHEDGGPHATHQVIVGRGRHDARGHQAHRSRALAWRGRFNAQPAQEIRHGSRVAELWIAGQGDRLVGQEGGRHQWQRGVLRAVDCHRPLERLSAPNTDAVHPVRSSAA